MVRAIRIGFAARGAVRVAVEAIDRARAQRAVVDAKLL
jgi:hypothetical protein